VTSRDRDVDTRPGGDLELALLRALWERGPSSAKELHDVLGPERGIVYTTVAKVLDRLHDKRLVARKRSGRAYVYEATASRTRIQRALAGDLIERLLGGAPHPAMAALVDALADHDPACLDELAALIEAKRGGGDGA